MPNSRHFTSSDVKKIFEYAITKINFTEEGLTRDTRCTKGLNHTENKYVDSVIQDITEQNNQLLDNNHNSHDWTKILKHVFQNGQIINFTNLAIFKEWREFSAYSRNTFAETENPEKQKEYVLELKKFMAKVINHGAIEEMKCMHLMLNFAHEVFSQDTTTTNTSSKVASMLCSTFYDGLQLEGIIKPHTLFDMDSLQSGEYIKRVQNCAYFLKAIIEDPLFSSNFKKTDYAQYLVVPKLEITEDNLSEKKISRKPRSYSLENTSTLDPEFINAFKKLSVIQVSKSAPELSVNKNTEITFSYSNGTKIASQFIDTNPSLETVTQDITATSQKKTKKRLSLSIFTK